MVDEREPAGKETDPAIQGSDGKIRAAGGDSVEIGASETAEGERREGDVVDPRARAAWCKWLSALASDSDAAMAAALAYESLPDGTRDAWLSALEADAPDVGVPLVALYAPLLAVEAEPARRARIERAMGAPPASPLARTPDSHVASPPRAHALRGIAPGGEHVCVVVSPLYLDFVELLVCRYTPDGGLESARHEPLCHLSEQLPAPELVGVELEVASLQDVVEELAHAVVADRRAARPPPPALSRFVHLFVPSLESSPHFEDDPHDGG